MILPLNNFVGNSEGENEVWEKFSDYLPSDYISFHNYHLGLKQADVILLVPKRGVLIIEIKGFYPKNIIDVPDRTIIRVKNQPACPSPFEQAIKYRNIFINDFLTVNDIDSIYVTCAVCYPFVSKSEYESIGLNKISHKKLTMTFEDLENKDMLLKKIDDIFDHTYQQVAMPNLIKYGFNEELVEKVGNIISPSFRNTTTVHEETDDFIELSKRDNYSHFIYAKDNMSEEKINEIINEWIKGTKIYFYTNNSELLNKLCDGIKNTLKHKELTDRMAFSFKNNATFLFSVDIAPTLNNSFEIINGEEYENYIEQFASLHNSCNFNKDQYEIEHAPLENIMIKAGAGTGKTFSMVSRINYLVWKKDYDAGDMKNAIAMITFTNESANAMKEKLSENFLNYYLLTRSIEYLDFVESVEDINISTIHSISKKILQKYSAKLGLGKDFSVVTGDYKRKQILQNKLNKFIEGNPDFDKKIDLSMFHLAQRLNSFLDKLDNKNVDIVSDFNELNFGKATNHEFNQLITVIRDTQQEMNEYCQTQNCVSLGSLIRKLKELKKILSTKNTMLSDKIDFLFVDEFQDTDDIQIELIKSFKELFSFKLFVVGDIKQCIYRFRGAEVKAFDTLLKGLKEPIKTISLNKNYRTDTLLLQNLNEMFSRWNSDNNIEYSGDDILKGTKLYCEKPEFYNLTIPDEASFEGIFIKSLTRLKEQLNNPSDKIAILVRYNWQIAKIREICEKNKINIETEIGGELFRIDPTIDLYKLILALKNNRSSKYLYNLYTTSFINEDMPKVELWSKNEEEIVEYFYSNLPTKLSKWNEYIERLRSEPILKVLRDIVEFTKPWNIFSSKIGSIGDDIDRCESYYIRNLDQLFEKLISASNIDYLTINKLSDYLEIMILTRREEEARESYDLEKSSAQIICTTVHKSKGLEFDTLLLPYCDFDISCKKPQGDVDLIYSNNEIGYRVIGSTYSVYYKNDLYEKFEKDELVDRKHEETRILYVALTRAVRRIVVFSKAKKTNAKKSDSWADMIKEV